MRSVLRVAAVMLAVPVGAVVGFLGAGSLCAAILTLPGTGIYHNNQLTIFSMAGVGAVVSGTLLPWFVWRFIRPVRVADNGKVSKLGLVCLLILGCIGDYVGILGVTSSPKANWYAVPVIGVSTVMILIGIYQWARANRERA